MPERQLLYSVRGPKVWSEMTSAEIGEALQLTDAILIGVSSTEQAGPHLPVSSDNIICTEHLRRCCWKLAQEGLSVVPGPVIPFGIIPYFLDYPGSVNLSASTMKAVIKDVCNSVYRCGFRRIGLLMGHVGNIPIMQVAAQEVVDETDAQVMVLNSAAAGIRNQCITTGPSDGHAGEAETACNMAIQPELLRMDLAETNVPQTNRPRGTAIPADRPSMFGGGVDLPIKNYRAIMPRGSQGDPFAATVETGERILETTAEWHCAVIKKHWFPDR